MNIEQLQIVLGAVIRAELEFSFPPAYGSNKQEIVTRLNDAKALVVLALRDEYKKELALPVRLAE